VYRQRLQLYFSDDISLIFKISVLPLKKRFVVLQKHCVAVRITRVILFKQDSLDKIDQEGLL